MEQEWGEQFADILGASSRDDGGYRPGWYTGSAWRPGAMTGFVSSLGTSLSGAISSASTSPGSSSGSGEEAPPVVAAVVEGVAAGDGSQVP